MVRYKIKKRNFKLIPRKDPSKKRVTGDSWKQNLPVKFTTFPLEKVEQLLLKHPEGLTGEGMMLIIPKYCEKNGYVVGDCSKALVDYWVNNRGSVIRSLVQGETAPRLVNKTLVYKAFNWERSKRATTLYRLPGNRQQ